MKAFLTACVVVVAVSLVAGFGLNAVQAPTGQERATDNVRLD